LDGAARFDIGITTGRKRRPSGRRFAVEASNPFTQAAGPDPNDRTLLNYVIDYLYVNRRGLRFA
jgi:hypothetical protein